MHQFQPLTGTGGKGSSANGGGSWGNVPGATSATYAFAGTMADAGKLYRAVFTNSALFDIQTDADISYTASVMPSLINSATGTIRKSTSAENFP